MSTTSARIAAPVMEVFASFQGEGLFVGQPQVFLRLAGCPLRCSWCDTPASWELGESRKAVVRRDGEPPAKEDRWASPFQAALWVASVEPGEPRPVSITGGEPLIWPDFIRALRSMLRPRPIHLETAGAHPEALARVLDRVDHVSLDLKLPSDMGAPVELPRDADAVPYAEESGQELSSDDDSPGGAGSSSGDGPRPLPISESAPVTASDWQLARRRCLDLVKDESACAKVVVHAGTNARAYDELFEDVARRAPELPVFIAPATPIRGVEAPSYEHLVEVTEQARDLQLDVRVLPQVHRAMGIA